MFSIVMRLLAVFVSGAIGVGGLITTGVQLQELLVQHASSSWPRVRATIDEAWLARSSRTGHDEPARAKLVLEYAVDDSTYALTEEVSLPSSPELEDVKALNHDFPELGSVEIAVDPDNPARATSTTGVRSATLLLLGLALVAGALGCAYCMARAITLPRVFARRSREASIEFLRRRKRRLVERAARAEAECARDPARFVARLHRLSRLPTLGAAGIGAIFLVALATFTFGLLTGQLRLTFHSWKLPVALVAALGAVGKGLVTRRRALRHPGFDLTRTPRLAAAIERLRLGVQAPPIARVRFSDDFNAGIALVPASRPFAAPEHELTLGLPLLLALSPDRFEAVLAHELGHGSARHNAKQLQLYRGLERWRTLLDHMQRDENKLLLSIMKPLDEWFAARFFPALLVAARLHEYEADAYAAAIVRARTCADMLLELKLRGRFLTDRFPSGPEPSPPPLFSAVAAALAEPRDPELERSWLDELLAVPTALDDSHPCLRERLTALGQAPRVPPPVATSAAAAFLGDALPEISAAVERQSIAAREMVAALLKPGKPRRRSR